MITGPKVSGRIRTAYQPFSPLSSSQSPKHHCATPWLKIDFLGLTIRKAVFVYSHSILSTQSKLPTTVDQ